MNDDLPAMIHAPEAVMDLKNRVLDYVREHEQHCTTTGQPGTPCWGERCNIIAFLCHGLGVRGEHLYGDVSQKLAAMDQKCSDPNCKHAFN